METFQLKKMAESVNSTFADDKSADKMKNMLSQISKHLKKINEIKNLKTDFF